jgi:hypothetical protein
MRSLVEGYLPGPHLLPLHHPSGGPPTHRRAAGRITRQPPFLVFPLNSRTKGGATGMEAIRATSEPFGLGVTIR